MAKVRKTYLLEEGLVELIRRIKNDNHYNSETAVVIEAVNTLNRKLNPGYVNARVATIPRTPEEKAEAQINMQNVRKKKEEEALLAIVTALDGKVVRNDSGGKTVKYYTYDRKNRYLQELPLTMMTEELVESQYFPSKQEVEKLQAEGNVNYTPGTWE